MSEYYNIVPWFNSEEWLTVYDKIYVNQNYPEALNLLRIWKARCPSLPAGVESTFTLLEAIIQDEKDTEKANEYLNRLAYSTAVMRFVNHMLDAEIARGMSLYHAAKTLNLPDWMVDLRHDIAHNSGLPSHILLLEASMFGISWLQQNYWDKHKECIQDYTTGQKELEITESNKIAALMHFCLSLSFCGHSKCDIKNLSDIPNLAMRESIVGDARDLFGDHMDFSNLKTVSVTSLINMLYAHSKKLLKNKNSISEAVNALLDEDSLFLSNELLNLLSSNDFYHKKRLNHSYVQCFEVFLTFLHANDILLDFVLELIEITNKAEDEGHKYRLCALWVSEILKALARCKQFTDRMKRTRPEDLKSKKKSELKLLYHHWFPNVKIRGLLLDLQKPVPPQLMDIKFLQPIISSYNPYLKYFIQDLLALVQPSLPDSVTTNICQLAELISSPHKFPMDSMKIYTTDDVQDMAEQLPNDSVEFSEPMDVATSVKNTVTRSYGIWKQTSINCDWSKCPIGLVPIPKP